MRRFDGKIALVTGSTLGLGQAIAERLALEGAEGVVVTGRDEERGAAVAAQLGESTDAVFIPTELGDPDGPAELIAAADERFGRLDVLVNAAGLSTRGSIDDTTVELFDRLMAVNVRAPLMLMQGVSQIMRRESIEGTMVNIGSVASYGSEPFLTPYAASKAALTALTKNIAHALLWDRIRVNILNIGWMDTPTEDKIQRQYHSDGNDWLEEAEANRPFGRLLKPAEVAGAVAFLASGDSGMMTGAAVDFDQTILGGGTPVPPPRPS